MYKFVLWEWTSLPHSVCLIILCLPFHLVSTFVSFSITSKLSSFVIFAKPSTQFWETILNASTIDLTLTPGMCLLVTIQAKSPSSNWSQRPAPWSQHSEDIQVGLTAESPPHAAHPPGGLPPAAWSGVRRTRGEGDRVHPGLAQRCAWRTRLISERLSEI